MRPGNVSLQPPNPPAPGVSLARPLPYNFRVSPSQRNLQTRAHALTHSINLSTAGVGKLQPQMSMVQEDHREFTNGSASEKRSRTSATPADNLFAGTEVKREEAVDDAAVAGASSVGASAAGVPGVAITSQPTAMQGGERDSLGRGAEAGDRAAQRAASPSSAAQGPGRPSDAQAGPTSPGARGGIAGLPTPTRPRLPSGIGKLNGLKPINTLGGGSEGGGLLPASSGSFGISHGSGAALRGNKTALPALDRTPSRSAATEEGK